MPARDDATGSTTLVRTNPVVESETSRLPPAISSAGALVPRRLDRDLRFRRDDRRRIASFVAANVAATTLLVSSIGAPAWWTASALIAAPILYLLSWASAMRPGAAATRIARARLSAGRDRRGAIDALETIAMGAWTPENQRLEAAGHSALLSLDQGDIDRAIATLSIDAAGASRRIRDRGLERGLIGEVLRSLVAWLRPDAPIGPIAHSAAFELDPSQRTGLARAGDVELFHELVDVLRVLERSAGGDTLALAGAWETCKANRLARRHPGLHTIARVAAARSLVGERASLLADLAADSRLRAYVDRIFPGFEVDLPEGPHAYRVAAEADDADSEDVRALATLSAPAELREALARSARSRELQIFQEPPVRRAARTLAAGTSLVVLSTMMAQVLAPALFGLAAMVGAGLIVSSIRKVVLHARARSLLAPLLASAETRPAEPWIREFAASPLILGGASGLREQHVLLYVACAMAQRDLLAGRPDLAWSRVQWWFRGMSVDSVELQPLFPVAACLLRVAAMAGMLGDARRLARALDRLDDGDLAGRTAYGTAPSAIALARALLSARTGNWKDCAAHLRAAGERPALWMYGADRLLYARLREHAAAQGEHAPAPELADDATTADDRAWLRAIWPELAA